MIVYCRCGEPIIRIRFADYVSKLSRRLILTDLIYLRLGDKIHESVVATDWNKNHRRSWACGSTLALGGTAHTQRSDALDWIAPTKCVRAILGFKP